MLRDVPIKACIGETLYGHEVRGQVISLTVVTLNPHFYGVQYRVQINFSKSIEPLTWLTSNINQERLTVV